MANFQDCNPINVADRLSGKSTLLIQNCDISSEEPVQPTVFDGSLRGVYLECCKQHSVIPASYFLRHMNDQHLQMKHHGLGPSGIKPLAVAMVVGGTFVEFCTSKYSY